MATMDEKVASNAASSHTQPPGILVTSHVQPKHPTSIRWDEAVIEEHNLLRGTRAPITEPKTPYNRERVDEEEDEQPSPIDPAELASRLAMLQEDSDSQQQQQQQQQQEEFKEKRKKHYNEFVESRLRLQALAEKDDEEEQDD